jgi:hypothetical protein
MEPFYLIVPEAKDPVMTLVLTEKRGRIPKGRYGFVEYYCTERGCDCRRVLLLVVNEKQKSKAVINFGFDQHGPMAGPYLDTSNKQSPYAADLLQFFVDSINRDGHWLERMYRQYRQVRERVEGSPYQGKPFPKPGKLEYQVTHPDFEAEMVESLKQLRAASKPGAHTLKRKKPGRSATCHPGTAEAALSMSYFVDRYLDLAPGGSIGPLITLRAELSCYLLENDDAGDELAALLPTLYTEAPAEEDRLQAAMRLLYDVLDFWRVEVGEGQPGAERQMERLQEALAQRVYLEADNVELAAMVTSMVVQSGAEVLPVLRVANSRMIEERSEDTAAPEFTGEEVLAGISRSIEAMGITSPFDGVQALVELFMLNEPELQLAILAELLEAPNPLLREIAALMLFSPEHEVRLGMARLLAASDGKLTTSDTLRRLIVSRNWFGEEIRKQVDQAISNARKARVECASLPKAPAMTVYVSPMDGSGAQSFQVVVQEGKSYLSGSILIKQGRGVTDTFVVTLQSKRDHRHFLDLLSREGFFLESSPEYLDRRICQALGDGAASGTAPNHWLVRIAELLGRDRWNAASFDAAAELEQMREKLAARHPVLLDETEHRAALEESAEWHQFEPIFSSWFEDDDQALAVIEASRGNRKSVDATVAQNRILGLLEERRDIWLERLLIDSIWLDSCKRPPLPSSHVFHVALAVADDRIRLKEIPFMRNIARLTYEAYKDNKRESRQRLGAVK